MQCALVDQLTDLDMAVIIRINLCVLCNLIPSELLKQLPIVLSYHQ